MGKRCLSLASGAIATVGNAHAGCNVDNASGHTFAARRIVISVCHEGIREPESHRPEDGLCLFACINSRIGSSCGWGCYFRVVCILQSGPRIAHAGMITAII
eukprot:6186582-Pleurochrysis_carterae.AAC.2